MIEYIPQKDNEYRSLTQFVLDGINFRPIDMDEDFESEAFSDDVDIKSGSIRDVMAYSELLKTDISVAEMHAIVLRKSTNNLFSSHTLSIEHENMPILDEVCLDSGIVVSSEYKTESKEQTKARIIKALSAVADYRFGFTISN